MVRPALRSRSRRRVARRVPSGEPRVFYERDYRYVARCALCGGPLGGVPRDLREVRSGPRSSKRPERPFGGVLCPRCLAVAYKVAIRGL